MSVIWVARKRRTCFLAVVLLRGEAYRCGGSVARGEGNEQTG